MSQFNLKPVTPETTERDDLLAAFRYWISDHYNHMIYLHNRSVKGTQIKNFEYLKEDEAVESLLKLEHNIKEMLAEQHMGDCVKIACTCGRCFAESMYNIPSTVNWVWRAGKMELKND